MIRALEKSDIAETLKVRTATIENAITLEELQTEFGVNEQSLQRALDGSVNGWVFQQDAVIVGFVMGDQSSGELLVLAVLPKYEGRGIGKALLKRMEQWLFANGHDQIWLLTTPNPKLRAHGFYQHQGWKPTGEFQGDDEVLVLNNSQSTI